MKEEEPPARGRAPCNPASEAVSKKLYLWRLLPWALTLAKEDPLPPSFCAACGGRREEKK